MSKMHYRGSIADHRGSMLGGWAACCSGDRAVAIRAQGLHTWDAAKVTCKACMRRMASHAVYWADPSRSQAAVDFFIEQNGYDPRALADKISMLPT